jgi:2,5-dihydroxypyridine 5,6-dioxygenase
MSSEFDLFRLFAKQYELSNLKEGEVLVAVTEPRTRASYTDAALGAAAARGAHAFEIRVPGLGWNAPGVTRGIGGAVAALARPAGSQPAIKAALQAADFVIDLTPERMTHIAIRSELQAANTRILSVNEPPDVLERLFPTERATQAVRAAAARLRGGSTLTVTTAAGTQLTYNFDRVSEQIGCVPEPGTWDHWPSALVNGFPRDGEVHGEVLLDRGDLLFPHRRYIEEPVRLLVRDGYVTDIDGGLDAALMRDFLQSWDEPEVFAISHFSVGLHPQARWGALEFYDKSEIAGMDGRCFLGAFLFTTGPNRYTKRFVEAHLDMALRNCTVMVDGTPIVLEGRLASGLLRRAVETV